MPAGALIHLSNHAGVIQATGTAADFTNILGNSGPGKKPHALGVKHMTVAHRFPNINQYNNSISLSAFNSNVPATIIGGNIEVSEGQYTITALLTAINAISSPNVTFAAGADGLVTATKTDGNDYTVNDFSGELLTVLGLPSSFRLAGSLSGIATGGGGAPPLGPVTLTGVSPPYLGGPTMLFLHSRTLAPGNMIHGDGRTYNVLETIDLSGVPYGGLAKKDVDADMINMITYDAPEELSNIELFITDERMRKLTLPANSPVNVVLRVLHSEDDL